VTVYEVPHPRPIVTGPALASIVWMYPTRAVLDVDAQGTYRVALRWSPYWRSQQGCVAKGKDGMVRLHVAHAGLVNLAFRMNVHSGLEALAGLKTDGACGD
jgi:hypothetical protein